MTQGYCPDCDKPVQLGDQPSEGQLVTCRNCGAMLQVTSLAPVELGWAYEFDDDEEEEYEYEYELGDDDDEFDDYED